MTLLAVLLSAVQTLPNATYISQRIKAHTMSLSQKIIAALLRISKSHSIYLCDEPILIEKVIEIIGLPFDGDSYRKVHNHLFVSAMPVVMKKLGVEFALTEMQQEMPLIKLGASITWYNGVKIK